MSPTKDSPTQARRDNWDDGMTACCRKCDPTIACNRIWKAPAVILQYVGALLVVSNGVLAEGGEAGAGEAGRS